MSKGLEGEPLWVEAVAGLKDRECSRLTKQLFDQLTGMLSDLGSDNGRPNYKGRKPTETPFGEVHPASNVELRVVGLKKQDGFGWDESCLAIEGRLKTDKSTSAYTPIFLYHSDSKGFIDFGLNRLTNEELLQAHETMKLVREDLQRQRTRDSFKLNKPYFPRP